MKFKVSKNDLIVFVVFCILLLYLCAIGVMNFVTFGSQGHLWGLNPFPAFVDYLGITLLLFVVSLIMIFTSVSSYIFTREKGPGIGIKIGEKEEKGYSRWAKEKEVKTDRDVVAVRASDPTLDAAGIPLAYKDDQIWVDNGEYHTLVIGASGSGKSRCIVKPLVNLLAKHGESMIVTDPKGELYVDSAEHLKDLGYNVVVLNFRDPAKGNAWNPLTLPYEYMKAGNKDKATELLDDVALNILYDPNNKNDPFWEKSSADYFSGLALGLFDDAKKEEINFNSISFMSIEGEDRMGTSHVINEYFNLKGKTSAAYTFASNVINAPADTQGGVLATFRQKIRMFASRENLSEMLGHSDFDMLDIGRKKTAVFIIIHDEKTTYHSLATIFIKQCYETLIDVAQENGGKLPYRTNFILDEFQNMPPLKDVDSMVTAARSRLMRFTFIIQNFSALNDVYGKEVAEVIRGNCGNTIYLISTELAALEEISKMCGDVKSKDKDKTASTPLVTITDLQKFKMYEALLRRIRLNPFKTKLPLNDKMDWGYTIKPAQFPTRELKPIAIFDIKEFVKEKKRQKMMEAVNNNEMVPGNGMFGPGFNDNPFSGMMSGRPMPQGMGQRPDFGGLDLDAMIKDIDRKIAELDAEEAKEKEKKAKELEEAKAKEANAKPDLMNTPIETEKNIDLMNKPIEDEEEKVVVNTQPVEEEEKLIVTNKHDEEDSKKDLIKEQIETINNNEKLVEKETVSHKDIDESLVLPNPTNIKKQEKNQVKEDEIINTYSPKINIDADSIVVNDSVISDDEFFDDFFGDDDF